MNESIFKRIWNYSITVGQMIITAFAMAVVSGISAVERLIFDDRSMCGKLTGL